MEEIKGVVNFEGMTTPSVGMTQRYESGMAETGANSTYTLSVPWESLSVIVPGFLTVGQMLPVAPSGTGATHAEITLSYQLAGSQAIWSGQSGTVLVEKAPPG